jgi:DNA-binding NarL/FixJ family response regulator
VSDPIRVLLVDDHPLVRAGIRRVLETRPGLTVVGEASNGAEAISLVESLEPDIVVLDLTMPEVDGLDVLNRLRRRSGTLRILVLTMHAQGEYVRRAIDAGADGYVLKESAVQELLTAIDMVRNGHPYYSPRIEAELAQSMESAERSPDAARLTGREREVLRGIARGLSTKEMAARLAISARTVETHRANLMRKLEIRSIARLTQYAIRAGLVDGP